MTRLRPLLAALAASALLATGCTPQEAAEPSESTNADLLRMRKDAGIPDCPRAPSTAPVAGGLPDLALECLGTGSRVSLSGLPKGKPWVINYWAQWCEPCRAEAPYLSAAWKKYGDQVNFLGVNQDPEQQMGIGFAHEANWPWPHVVDPKGRSKQGITADVLPVTLLVDKDGRIAYKKVGGIASAEQLDELMVKHLGLR